MTGTKMPISEIRNEAEFNIPRQVAFWNDAEMNYVGGIWVGKNIICGCCGATMDEEPEYLNRKGEYDYGIT